MFSGARKKNRSDNRYELIEVIGDGGMGVVWKAFDRNLGGEVALKTLLDTFDKTAFKLFQEEVKKLVALPHHPNIIRIMDVGEMEHDGQRKPFFSMPLLTGATLAERMKTSPDQLTVEQIVDIASQTCRGLQVAHSHGLIHRDIKPSNIFVLNDFSIQIIDFGVAHRTNVSERTVGRKGTLHYMSPEQVQGRPLTAASDFFSLGVVCYEMLSGCRPFEGDSEGEIGEEIQNYSPRPLHQFRGINVAISQAVHKALAKQPSNRYLTATEFSEHLQKALRTRDGELFPLPRPRLHLARENFQKGNYDFARKLLATLQAEGTIHPEISELENEVDAAVRLRTIALGIEQTRSLMHVGDYNEAAKQIKDVLAQDPNNADALALERQIDGRRADADVEELLRQARQCLDSFAFDLAREALERVRKRRAKEPRIALLSSEIRRLEEEHRQIQTEKQKHFAAAVSALGRKDISSAFSHAERLLELDQRSPEIPDPRRAEYQSVCTQVRTERQSIENALIDANRYIEAGNLQDALTLCQKELEKYPTHEHLLHLQFRIEELHRQALTARIGEIDKLLHSEGDINRRIRILEGVLRDYPGESHFERQLQQTRNLRNVIEGIVAKASAHKERKEYAEAHQEWQKLKTIYPGYAALDVELEQIARLKSEHEKRQAQARLVQQIDRNLEASDFIGALELIRRSSADLQSHAEISALEKLAVQGIYAKEHAQELLAQGKIHCKERRYEEGLRLLHQAHEQDSTDPGIRSTLLESLIEFAQTRLDVDSKVAEASIREALDLDPDHTSALGLLQIIRDQRQHQIVEAYIAKALEFQTAGRLREAMNVFNDGLRECPNDLRILQRQSTLRKQLEDEKVRDRDSAKRLVRESEGVAHPVTLREYSGRLSKIAERHPDDAELQETVKPFYRRLQTMVNEPEAVSNDEGASGQLAVDLSESEQPDNGQKHVNKSWLSMVSGIPSAISNLPVWSVVASAALITLLFVWGISGLAGRWRRSDPIAPRPSVVPSHQSEAVVTPPAPPPVQPQNLSISGNSAYVTLDQNVSQQTLLSSGEDFRSELPDGEHTVQVFITPTQKLSFALRAQADVPALLTVLQSQNLPVVIVSSKGKQGRIYASPALTISFNGNSLGSVNEAGKDLPVIAEDRQILQVGIGNSTVSKDLVFATGRAVMVLLKPDPSLGGLMIKSNQDGVRLELSDPKGKILLGVTRSGKYQFSNLKPGNYSLTSTKDGFIARQQSIAILASRDVSEELSLTPVPTSATLAIRTTPGAAIAILGGKQIGTASTPDGTFIAQDLPAGPMTFEVRSKGYRTVSKSVDLRLGDNGVIDIPVAERAPAILRIKRNPEDTTVTYERGGDGVFHSLSGDLAELPEGLYTVKAEAKGFETRGQSVTLRAGEQTEIIDLTLTRAVDTQIPDKDVQLMATPYDKNWVKEGDGAHIHRAKGVVIMRTTPGEIIKFTAAPVSGVIRTNKLQWVVGFKPGDFVRCVIDGSQYTSYLIEGTKATAHGRATLKKQAKYRIEVSATATKLMVKVFQDGQWSTLEDWSEVPRGLLEGQFGFQDQIRLYDFNSR